MRWGVALLACLFLTGCGLLTARRTGQNETGGVDPSLPPPPSGPLELTLPALSRSRLDSGVTLVTSPSPTSNQFRLVVGLPLGPGSDPPGVEGAGFLMSHAVFRAARPGGIPFSREMEQLGVPWQLEITHEGCLLDLLVPPGNLEPVVVALAQTLSQLQRDVVEVGQLRDELVARVGWEPPPPPGVVGLRQLLFQQHPVSREGVDSRQLTTLNIPAAQDYLRRQLIPPGVVVVLVGPVQAVPEGVWAPLADLEVSAAKVPAVVPVSLPSGREFLLIPRPDDHSATLHLGNTLPGRGAQAYMTTQVVAELWRRRVSVDLAPWWVESGDASAPVGVEIRSGRQISLLHLFTRVKVEEVTSALGVMFGVIDSLRSLPASDEEVAAAVEGVRAQWARSLASPSRWGRCLANLTLSGGRVEELPAELASLLTLQAADVWGTAQKVLLPEQMALVGEGPPTLLAPALGAFGYQVLPP